MRFRQNYRIAFGAAGTDDPLYEAVSAGRKHAGIEHWLGFFQDDLETLFDYLPRVTISLDDQISPQRSGPLGQHRRSIRHADARAGPKGADGQCL